jgi:hypothetical protein
MAFIKNSIFFLLISALLFGIPVSCGDDDDDDDNDDDDDFGDDDDDDSGDDDDDDSGDDDDDDDDDTTLFFSDNFDSYSPGPLPAPWTVGGNEEVTIEIAPLTKDGSGNVVKIQDDSIAGGLEMGQGFVDLGEIPELETVFAYEYDIRVDTSGGNIWMGIIDFNSFYFIVDYQADGIYMSGNKCADLVLGQWYTVTQLFNPANLDAKLMVDHENTICNGSYSEPINHITGVMFEYWDETNSTASYMIDNVRVYNTDPF